MPHFLKIVGICLVLQQVKAKSGGDLNHIPELLRGVFEAREAFSTAKFEIRLENARSGFATRTHNHTIEFANNSVHLLDHGDDDGMIMYANLRTGEAPIGVRGMYSPQEWVLDDKTGSVWSRRLNSPLLTLCTPDYWSEYIDVRTYGLGPISIQRRSPSKMLELYNHLTFSESAEKDGLTKITGIERDDTGKESLEYEWVIARNQGPSVVSARLFEVEPDNQRILVAEVTNVLALIDGRWWPLRSEYTTPRVNGHRTVEFGKIEFNRKDHLKLITADSMGIPEGAFVSVISREGAQEYYIGGGVTVDKDTWKTIRSQYNLSNLKAFNAQAAAFGACDVPSWWMKNDGSEGIGDVADRPDLWEAYVRRWVMRRTNHSIWRVAEPLTDAQRVTAKSILDECRTKAVPIRTRLDKESTAVAADLAAAEAALTALQSAKRRPPNGDAHVPEAKKAALDSEVRKEKATSELDLNDKIKTLQQRKVELEKSPEIERIFNELKSRLEGMLTTKQKDPANGSFQRPPPTPLPQSPHGARPVPSLPAPTTSRPSPAK